MLFLEEEAAESLGYMVIVLSSLLEQALRTWKKSPLSVR
jgi:hypothetical protein